MPPARTRALAKLVRKRICPTRRRVGEIRKAARRGRNEIAFTGRLAGRKVASGKYLAVLLARDDAGNLSRRETIRFRAAGPKKSRPATTERSSRT